MRRDPGSIEPRWPVVTLATVAMAASLAALATGRDRRPAQPLSPRVIDLDRADAVDLDLLPGIGPALAARILADREAHGPFGCAEGLERVRGVGPAIVEGIRPYVRAGGHPDRDDG